MKYFWMQFFVADWLNDPQVSACEPATRGIMMDWLCRMHLSDRSGQITGTHRQLAQLGRCTPVEVESALQDLIRTGAFDVTEHMSQNVTRGDKIVTVTNRRMHREWKALNSSMLRKRKQREREARHAAVTVHSHNSEVISHICRERVSTLEGGPAEKNGQSLLVEKGGEGINAGATFGLQKMPDWQLRKDLRETKNPAEREALQPEPGRVRQP